VVTARRIMRRVFRFVPLSAGCATPHGAARYYKPV